MLLSKVAEQQIAKSKRPTLNSLVIVRGGDFDGKAGVIVSDAKDECPFYIKSSDGTQFGPVHTHHCGKMTQRRVSLADVAVQQHSIGGRPVKGNLVKVKDSGPFAGRAGIIEADDHFRSGARMHRA